MIRLLTHRQFAHVYGLDPVDVERQIQAGDLPAVQSGNSWILLDVPPPNRTPQKQPEGGVIELVTLSEYTERTGKPAITLARWRKSGRIVAQDCGRAVYTMLPCSSSSTTG